MSSCSCSYVEMDNVAVKALAQNTIDRILKSRQKDVDRLFVETKKAIAKHNAFWDRICFWREPSPITDEDVWANMKEPFSDWTNDSAYNWTQIKYGNQENLARKLLIACDKATVIKLSIDDLNLIS